MQTTNNNDPIITIADNLTEHDWKSWLESYTALRARVFLNLLETRRKEIAR